MSLCKIIHISCVPHFCCASETTKSGLYEIRKRGKTRKTKVRQNQFCGKNTQQMIGQKKKKEPHHKKATSIAERENYVKISYSAHRNILSSH